MLFISIIMIQQGPNPSKRVPKWAFSSCFVSCCRDSWPVSRISAAQWFLCSTFFVCCLCAFMSTVAPLCWFLLGLLEGALFGLFAGPLLVSEGVFFSWIFVQRGWSDPLDTRLPSSCAPGKMWAKKKKTKKRKREPTSRPKKQNIAPISNIVISFYFPAIMTWYHHQYPLIIISAFLNRTMAFCSASATIPKCLMSSDSSSASNRSSPFFPVLTAYSFGPRTLIWIYLIYCI